jgi:hypothetical protein
MGAATADCEVAETKKPQLGHFLGGCRAARGRHPCGDNPEAVVLDLVQPLAAGRQFIGFGWEARRYEPGRECTLQHGNPNTFG